jgi:hypothetical protein
MHLTTTQELAQHSGACVTRVTIREATHSRTISWSQLIQRGELGHGASRITYAASMVGDDVFREDVGGPAPRWLRSLAGGGFRWSDGRSGKLTG